MKLAISIDVEEEGLFSGRYPREAAGVSNVSQLQRLRFLSEEFGTPLTLLATYPVAADASCTRLLRAWRERFGAEIGAHLHSWNTPPFGEALLPEPIRPGAIPVSLLEAKLFTLISLIEENAGVRPASFRMGRFDLEPWMFGILQGQGILVDSSMVPLRTVLGGPDHFLCPPDPCWRHGIEGYPPLLEVPLTQVPLYTPLPEIVHRLGKALPRVFGDLLQPLFRHAGGVLGVHPAWFPLPSMKWAVRLHHGRGGQVLNLFLHSSELQPGASPQFRSEEDVKRLVSKIRLFVEWLIRNFPVEPVTLLGIRQEILDKERARVRETAAR